MTLHLVNYSSQRHCVIRDGHHLGNQDTRVPMLALLISSYVTLKKKTI